MRRPAVYTVILLYLCSLMQTEAVRLGHAVWHEAEALIGLASSQIFHHVPHLHSLPHTHTAHPHASGHRHPALIEWILGQDSTDEPQALPESGSVKSPKQTPQKRSETCQIPPNPEQQELRIPSRQEQLPAAPWLPVPELPPRGRV
ncbi:MAG: hypothetical protein NW241_08740 [Bacteroidia bacterium]|nr:hypothetical protein [Bacteroidia bacterium]